MDSILFTDAVSLYDFSDEDIKLALNCSLVDPITQDFPLTVAPKVSDFKAGKLKGLICKDSWGREFDVEKRIVKFMTEYHIMSGKSDFEVALKKTILKERQAQNMAIARKVFKKEMIEDTIERLMLSNPKVSDLIESPDPAEAFFNRSYNEIYLEGETEDLESKIFNDAFYVLEFSKDEWKNFPPLLM